jgi:hypothetical protein
MRRRSGGGGRRTGTRIGGSSQRQDWREVEVERETERRPRFVKQQARQGAHGGTGRTRPPC